MDKGFEAIYHSLEDENWWFKARQDFVLRFLKMNDISKESRLLDIGCGGGALLQVLAFSGYTDTYGVDVSPEAVAFARAKGITNVRIADAQEKQDFQEGFFDVIIAMDILEHLQNPERALQEWQRLLKNDGILLIFVPAFQLLWSQHDVINHHKTRYTKKRLFDLARNVNFKPNLYSYWNFMMFVPYLLLLKIKNYAGHRLVVLKRNRVFVNELLKIILFIENALIMRGAYFPFGVSFMASFKKE